MSNLPVDYRLLGRRLAEARKAAGKTQEEAAAAIGCSRPTFIAIEKGERPCKPEELVRLAELYGRSVHELVRPGVPAVSIEPHLRAVVQGRARQDDGHSAGQAAADASTLAVLGEVIAELQRFAEDYNELERLLDLRRPAAYPPEVRIPPRGVAAFADNVANAERARLGLGDQPLLRLREVLENEVGLRILYSHKLPSHVAGMYAYASELGYCIVINGKQPDARRRATEAHEYGHFLAERHRPGIDYLASGGRKPQGERFAEAFGMSFLMPAAGVRRQFFDTVAARRDFQVADLCRLSHDYGASVQAMTLRLEALNLVPAGTWDYLHEEGFKVRDAQRSLGIKERPAERYSHRYQFLAVQAFEGGLVSEGQLARLLCVDRIEARKIVERILSAGEFDDAGATTLGESQFDRSLLSASKSA